jgi:LmbE family N-acetylglucosaminyl deacetylase
MAILAIGAHPDDIEFGCYGTLAKLSKDNDIYFIVMSAGELSGANRADEALCSGELISARVDVWRYSDSEIPLNRIIIDRLRAEIEQIKPSTVFIPYGNDTHQDHRTVAQIAMSACSRVNKILYYEMTSSGLDFTPNVFYSITTTIDVKLRAIQCHASQSKKQYFNPMLVESLARYRALQCKHYGELFEAFQAYKIVEL